MNITNDPTLLGDEFAPRMARRYRPGQWIGALRKAFGPVSELEDDGDEADEALETHPPHFLAALWKPPALGMPFLPRWPFKVVLVAPDAAAALRDLLADVPASDRLWLTDQHVDWGLMARIVLLSEAGLRPFQRRAMQTLVNSEDQTTLAAIRLHYGGDAARLELEHFPSTRPGGLD